MPKACQLNLFGQVPRLKDHASRLTHGGDVRQGQRKLARPFDPKRPMHLVLRSSRARGEWSLLHPGHEKQVREIVHKVAYWNGVTVYDYANSGNHLHLLVRSRTRKSFQDFARTLGALIARVVTGARKGKPLAGGAKGKFWDGLMYSRVVEWGRAFLRARNYVVKNTLEGWNLIPHERGERCRPKPSQGDRPPSAAPPGTQERAK